ncbi:oxalate:formate antiporter [Elysia marginata]|uniref:Oxalate:formate antiporter n=1 Tax=Elysia marginata TaxID=1093978 RepID=A0AAV4JZN8_9GAST|nr:oxalate:formate antiporter [Elysia marginata]
MAPVSFNWICGNLLEYMGSYFRYSCYPGCYDGDSQWIFNINMAFFGIGLFSFDSIRRLIGLRWTCILSVIVHNATYFLSAAWSLHKSILLTCLLMGALMGLTAGLAMNTGFMYINTWGSRNSPVYLVTATVVAPLLSIVENQIITQVVNAENLKPNAHEGPRVFFSQPEVLSRVPTAILVLAAMTFVLQTVGCLLVSTPEPVKTTVLVKPKEKKTASPTPQPKTPIQSGASAINLKAKKAAVSFKKLIQCQREEEKYILCNDRDCADNKLRYIESNEEAEDICINNELNYKTIPEDTHIKTFQDNRQSDETSKQSPTKDITLDILQEESPDTGVVEAGQIQYSPSQAIKTTKFWSLWLYGFSIGLGMLLMDSYYKQFGLKYIYNDQHLTILGSTIPAVVSSCRILFSVLVQRQLLFVRCSLILSLTLNCITSAFWFFAARLNEEVYMLLVLVMAFSYSFLYFVIANGALQEFGKDNFANNYSMIYSGLPITSFLSAFFLTSLLNAVGWFWLFMTSSFVSFVALLFTICSMVISCGVKE